MSFTTLSHRISEFDCNNIINNPGSRIILIGKKG